MADKDKQQKDYTEFTPKNNRKVHRYAKSSSNQKHRRYSKTKAILFRQTADTQLYAC